MTAFDFAMIYCGIGAAYAVVDVSESREATFADFDWRQAYHWFELLLFMLMLAIFLASGAGWRCFAGHAVREILA